MDFKSYLSQDLIDRSRALNDNDFKQNGAYVLCWLQQTLRAFDNPVIDAAVETANKHDLPVLVYHGIRQDYPHASDRLHYFLLGGSRGLQTGCRERGIRCASYLQTPDNIEKGLVYRLAKNAAAVFLEDHPTFVARWQSENFSRKTDSAVTAVDAARLVPTRVLPGGLKTTPSFRAANKVLRDTYAHVQRDVMPSVPAFEGDLGFTEIYLSGVSDTDLEVMVAECDIDHSLWTCPEFPPSREVALAKMDTFIEEHLPRYKWTRNNPAKDGFGSQLSPYLHFGLLGPRELYESISKSNAHSAAKWKFLDEAITWREWFHYQAAHIDSFELFDGLPERAKTTLIEHAADEREELYSLDDLLHGRTSDTIWNAAQKQWLTTGYMHNNLRMYWGKKLLAWTPNPIEAWNTACYINDRLSLDGRDPATYGNMQWCFGKAKPGYREISVYGWVAPKSSAALVKRDGVNDWVAKMNDAPHGEISVPDYIADPLKF
ncbi:deoxyribodipyrimidine photo-lyase [Hellea sp.]|nr:deoxyribodipyrimidine photo-lyase [Hellea sp.]